MSIRDLPRALLITGTVGSGKTTVADQVGDVLAAAGTPHAVIDLDWLRRSWPTPPGDPFNLQMTLRNLRDVARNYLEAGVRRLVLAGVVESSHERLRHRDAVDMELTVVRLRADPEELHRRLTRRHRDEARLRWHLERSGALDRILDQARLDDATLDVTHLPVAETAVAVLAAAGWAPPR